MRYGFVIDQDRCIGCHACTVACKEEHNVPVGVYRTWVKYIEKGAFPATSRHFGVMRCNHCDAAPCVEICPTSSLFTRHDGIVDFDPDRCIGCKSCMQACPYDALYIDPATHTAAKCNYCAHRIEVGLEPACVIVCPTRAIIAGDLDDPESAPSRIVASAKVVSRKPHKGTRPKLFYVGIDGDLLDPNAAARDGGYIWAAAQHAEAPIALFDGSGAQPSAPVTRVVYDVAHPAPWGGKIAAYLWTKSIAAGVLLIAPLIGLTSGQAAGPVISMLSPAVAMLFTLITVALLIFDLKRPERFYFLLTKPNPRSWVVIGACILMAYGLCAAIWLLSAIVFGVVPPVLQLTAVALAIGAAGYSAFLFAQAKGRDLWQSPLFFWQLIGQAATAGAAAMLMLEAAAGEAQMTSVFAMRSLETALAIGLTMSLAEIGLPPTSEDVRRAHETLLRGPLKGWFWGGQIIFGTVLPLILLAGGGTTSTLGASALALAGLWIAESLWVRAGQIVPLS